MTFGLLFKVIIVFNSQWLSFLFNFVQVVIHCHLWWFINQPMNIWSCVQVVLFNKLFKMILVVVFRHNFIKLEDLSMFRKIVLITTVFCTLLLMKVANILGLFCLSQAIKNCFVILVFPLDTVKFKSLWQINKIFIYKNFGLFRLFKIWFVQTLAGALNSIVSCQFLMVMFFGTMRDFCLQFVFTLNWS